MINFGIIYGMGPFGLASSLNISYQESKDYIAQYFLQYPGIKEYMDNTINFAKINGYVTTIYNRRCYIDNNSKFTKLLERSAINAPIQGSASDIIKEAMVAIDSALEKFETKMILQVHDELIFEAPKNELDTVVRIIKSTMENIINLKVKLEVNISSGDNWKRNTLIRNAIILYR